MRYLVITLLAVIGLASVAAAQDIKIGYVQVERVMQNFPEHEDASRTFEKELQSWQTQLQEYDQEIQQMKEEFQQRAMLFSPEKQREKQEEILAKQQEATQFYQDVFGEGGKAAQRRAELWDPISVKINRAIQILGERENFTLIFDAQGLLFAQEALDATDSVVEILKAGVEIPASGTAPR